MGVRMSTFQPGDRLRTVNTGSDCVIEECHDGGTQGVVYRANIDGTTVAAKWYMDGYLALFPEQRRNLEELIRCGSPDARFLWPLDLVEADGSTGFGYVMPWRGPAFVGLGDYAGGTAKPRPSLFALAQAGFELADSFYYLHTGKGLCYRDFSFGNLFFDPRTGHIAVCDNDNAGPTGQNAGVLGTPGFMAPEIVRGESDTSRATDLWSLAVTLFYLFMLDHPLDGALEAGVKIKNDAAERWLYGDHAVFIFDPLDTSNYPVNDIDERYQVNAVARWPILPKATQELFVRAFTAGIRDPLNGRVQENEWRHAMADLQNMWLKCSCGAEYFHDIVALQASPSHQARPCWRCGQIPKLPPRIQIIDPNGSWTTVVLSTGKKLYPHHLAADSLFDFSRVLAEVAPHPQDPGLLVLRNRGADKWTVKRDDGTVVEIETDKAVALADQRRIVFGAKSGLVRA